jgi:transcriptional regulator with XRE-family HTH domain
LESLSQREASNEVYKKWSVTVIQVEERSGFSQQYLSSLERGRRNPTVITLYELAQALGVSHIDLVRPDETQ